MSESAVRANEAFVRVALANVLSSFYHRDLLREEWTDMEVRPYWEAGREKLAVLVAFLQDHSSPRPLLEDEVLAALLEEVAALELSPLVDDISVNTLQWRRGAVTRRHLTEEGQLAVEEASR